MRIHSKKSRQSGKSRTLEVDQSAIRSVQRWLRSFNRLKAQDSGWQRCPAKILQGYASALCDEKEHWSWTWEITEKRNYWPFSEWAAPIVPIMKRDESIGICGDCKTTINCVSKLDNYPIPKVEVLLASLGGGEKLSKLKLLLGDESKRYTAINTHKGLFQYNRLPFGVSLAPGIC